MHGRKSLCQSFNAFPRAGRDFKEQHILLHGLVVESNDNITQGGFESTKDQIEPALCRYVPLHEPQSLTHGARGFVCLMLLVTLALCTCSVYDGVFCVVSNY